MRVIPALVLVFSETVGVPYGQSDAVELQSITVALTWVEHPHKLPWNLVDIVQQFPIARYCKGLCEQAFQRFMQEGIFGHPSLDVIFSGAWHRRKKAVQPLLSLIANSLSNLILSSNIDVHTKDSGLLQQHIVEKITRLDADLYPPVKFRSSAGVTTANVHQEVEEDLYRTLLCEAEVECVLLFSSSPLLQQQNAVLLPPSSDFDLVECSDDEILELDDDAEDGVWAG